jgi:hypothetical protein
MIQNSSVYVGNMMWLFCKKLNSFLVVQPKNKICCSSISSGGGNEKQKDDDSLLGYSAV